MDMAFMDLLLGNCDDYIAYSIHSEFVYKSYVIILCKCKFWYICKLGKLCISLAQSPNPQLFKFSFIYHPLIKSMYWYNQIRSFQSIILPVQLYDRSGFPNNTIRQIFRSEIWNIGSDDLTEIIGDNKMIQLFGHDI